MVGVGYYGSLAATVFGFDSRARYCPNGSNVLLAEHVARGSIPLSGANIYSLCQLAKGRRSLL